MSYRPAGASDTWRIKWKKWSKNTICIFPPPQTTAACITVVGRFRSTDDRLPDLLPVRRFLIRCVRAELLPIILSHAHKGLLKQSWSRAGFDLGSYCTWRRYCHKQQGSFCEIVCCIRTWSLFIFSPKLKTVQAFKICNWKALEEINFLDLHFRLCSLMKTDVRECLEIFKSLSCVKMIWLIDGVNVQETEG